MRIFVISPFPKPFFLLLFPLHLGEFVQCGSLAQLAEHLTLNQGVTGSIPVWSTIFVFCRSVSPNAFPVVVSSINSFDVRFHSVIFE